MLLNDEHATNVHHLRPWSEGRRKKAPNWADIAVEGFQTVKLPPYTEAMNDITREELRSTLSAIEERMDRRIDRMEISEEKRSDSYRREQESRDRLYTERFEAMHKRLEDRDAVIDSKLDAVNTSVKRMSEKVDGFEKQLDGKLIDVKSSNRNAAWAMLAIAAATVVGIWGVNSTIIGSVTGFFDAGKTSMENQQGIEKLLQDSKLQSEETFKLLQQIQSQQNALQKGSLPPSSGGKGK